MLSAIMDICVTNALTLARLWKSLWVVSKVEGSVRARLAIPGLSCWEASVLDIGLSYWEASVLDIGLSCWEPSVLDIDLSC